MAVLINISVAMTTGCVSARRNSLPRPKSLQRFRPRIKPQARSWCIKISGSSIAYLNKLKSWKRKLHRFLSSLASQTFIKVSDLKLRRPKPSWRTARSNSAIVTSAGRFWKTSRELFRRAVFRGRFNSAGFSSAFLSSPCFSRSFNNETSVANLLR